MKSGFESLLEKFLNTVEKYRNNIFLIEDGGRKLTYGEVDIYSSCISVFLNNLGCKPGDRILIYIENRIEYVLLLLGCIKSKVIFVPIHPETNKYSSEYLLSNSSPKVIVKTDKEKIIFTSYLSEKTWTWDDINWEEKLELSSELQDIVTIIYTSGSSGMPKGVVETNKNIVFSVEAINEKIKNEPEDIILCGLPLNFDYSLYQIFLAADVGASVLLMDYKNMPLSLPRIMEEYRVTALPLVPSIINYIINYKLYERGEWKSLKYISSTGDILSTKNILILQSIFNDIEIYSMYGLTECKRVSILSVKNEMKFIHSVGKPLKGVEVSIVDKEGKEVKDNRVGELVVCGDNIMSGYWNSPEETSKKFVLDEKCRKIKLYTGDFFKMDEFGYLYYYGRDSSIIKNKGFRISTVKIENVIEENREVIEAIVFGWGIHDTGEEIVAVIETKEKPQKDICHLIEEHCKDRLEAYELPNRYIYTNEKLPKSNNGKKDRLLLKKRFKMWISNY